MAKICLSPNQALEEKLSNMHEQLAGATSRLEWTERALVKRWSPNLQMSEP